MLSEDSSWGLPSLSIPLPYSRSLVSPGKELVCSSGAPISATVTQGTPLDNLALVDSGI